MLKELIKKLRSISLEAAQLEKVPPVPPSKNMREPLQPMDGGAVPSVPPVPSKKTKVQREALKKPETFVSCGKCLHFKCHNQHGQGGGICNAGVMPGGASHWGETPHQCEIFNAKIEYHELPEPKPGALMVTCYSPAGGAFEVEARDTQHAEWLKQMNPRRGESK